MVLLHETGLAGTACEISGLFTADHLKQLKKFPELDERFFAAPEATAETPDEGFEFAEDEEVDVDAI